MLHAIASILLSEGLTNMASYVDLGNSSTAALITIGDLYPWMETPKSLQNNYEGDYTSGPDTDMPEQPVLDIATGLVSPSGMSPALIVVFMLVSLVLIRILQDGKVLGVKVD